MAENNGGSMMVGLLLGAAVGAGLALLLAPMSGDDARRTLGDSARRLRDGTRDQLDDVTDKIRGRAGELAAAIDAGKDAYRRSEESTPIGKE